MPQTIEKIPQGFTTITPSLNIDGAAKAIELYKKAFGAKELYRMDNGGKIMHACLEIGNSKIFLADIDPKMAPSPSQSSFYLYIDDVDAMFRQAEQAGMKVKAPLMDMFWGDRTGVVVDSFGNSWCLATHVREVSEEEMKEGQKKFMNAA